MLRTRYACIRSSTVAKPNVKPVSRVQSSSFKLQNATLNCGAECNMERGLWPHATSELQKLGISKVVFVNMLIHLYGRLSPRAAQFGREQNTVHESRYYTVRMLSKRKLTWLRQPDFQTDDTVHNAAQGGPTRAASRWPQFAVV